MLVTVALVVVLMLAVTQIFSIASRTMSGGQAISAAVRDAQAAQSVMARDFAAVANDGACFIIRSTRTAAFRSSADYTTAVDPTNPLKDDTNADGTVDTTYSPLLYNFRNHRLDYMMFFARDRYRRQTGNDGTMVAEMSGREAAIYYHHLLQPFTTDNYLLNGTGTAATTPGAGNSDSNPNNFLATQWVLGRTSMLLISPSGTPPVVNDSMGTAQYYYGASGSYSPLAFDTRPTNNGSTFVNAVDSRIQSSRYDVAGTSITDFTAVIGKPWLAGVMYNAGNVVSSSGTTYVATAMHNGQTSNAVNMPPNATYWSVVTVPWYKALMTGGANNDQRFRTSSFLEKPISAKSVSRQVPLFLPACTQYIVEYAGDFISQVPATPDNWLNSKYYSIGDCVEVGGSAYVAVASNINQSPPSGSWQVREHGGLNVLKPSSGFSPDGTVDFVPGTNQVQWYGLPRDTSGDGSIRENQGDVVPLRDVARAMWNRWQVEMGMTQAPPLAANIPFTGWPQYPFERVMPTTGVDAYAASVSAAADYYAAATVGGPEYLIAWGPSDKNRPKLIRITLVIDRPEASSNQFDGSSFEYVFKVGQ